jgi:hypothetical protein
VKGIRETRNNVEKYQKHKTLSDYNCKKKNHKTSECSFKDNDIKCFQCKEFDYLVADYRKHADIQQVNNRSIAINRIIRYKHIRRKLMRALLDIGNDLHLKESNRIFITHWEFCAEV